MPEEMYTMLAEPNTKVEYDLHGFIQNVYYKQIEQHAVHADGARLVGQVAELIEPGVPSPYLHLPRWLRQMTTEVVAYRFPASQSASCAASRPAAVRSARQCSQC